jgi:glycine/D-amino acid oxidase-like deaminating enzyme
VVVIGAGITGALVADALSAEQLSVVILERRAPACGSTAASTSLVSYEIDLGLVELAAMIGQSDAVRGYQLSAAATDDLAQIAASLPTRCGFANRSSLYLATRRRDAARLQREVEVRQRYGLDAEYWTKQQVQNAYGFPCHGALRTGKAGVLDPVRFTRALLDRAVSRGATLFSHTPARDIRQEDGRLLVVTDRGDMRARWVVYAMGYEMPAPLRAGMVALHSTYALVTEPLEDLAPWQDECIVWETSRPYFYMRATDDRRVMIGGADTPFKDAAWRERLMAGRLQRLERRLSQLLPSIPTETAFVWAGTFGETRDGLPYIGPMADCPQALYALGYGANGITFGAVAARILRDLCLGRPNDDARLFRLDR